MTVNFNGQLESSKLIEKKIQLAITYSVL